MSHDCIIVADSARARFFTLTPAANPDTDYSPNLVEVDDLIQAEKEASQGSLWSDHHSGRNRGKNGGSSHRYDDHRAQHSEELDRRFARDVAQVAANMARRKKTHNVVLVAEKRMLGILRSTLDPVIKTGVSIRELAKDLSKLNPLELHEHLAREQLIPPRRSPEV